MLAVAGSLSLSAEPTRLLAELKRPTLRLNPTGPLTAVNALAFSDDGETVRLYAAGFDKVIQTWKLEDDQFVHDPPATFRVPVGPGPVGMLNVLAVSADSRWLATSSGLGLNRRSPGFAQTGTILPRTPRDVSSDEGLIYVFRRDQPEQVYILRGHEGIVNGLAFGPPGAGRVYLASTSRKAEDGKGKDPQVVLWDVTRAPRWDEGTTAFVNDGRSPKVKSWATDVSRPGSSVGLGVSGGPGQLRIALAWGDKWLRVLDGSGTEDQFARDGEPGGNITVAVGATGKFLTGGVTDGKGYLQWWEGGGAAQLQHAGGTLLLNTHGASLAQPVGLSVGGNGNLAAVVVRIESEKGEPKYHLRLVDLRTRQRLKQLTLWEDQGPRPVLAIDPKGQFVAVAGGPEHKIHLFRTPTLEKVQPPLGGAGEKVDRVAFVRRRTRPGLRLNDNWVLDLSSRQLIEAPPDAWENDSAPDGSPPPVTPEAAETVTAAVQIPGKANGKPLQAVAYWNHNLARTRLVLYRTDSWERVREYTGHTQRITALAARADGKLLASAAEDHTVNVWYLGDAAEVVGQHGTLWRVWVDNDSAGKVVVTRAAAGASVEPNLKPGDVLTGIESGGKLTTLRKARDYYDYVYNHIEPGQKFTLHVRRGTSNLTARATAGQGVDQRKPLFMLFVFAGPKGSVPGRWIAWTPQGPYDFQGTAQDEALVGWHRNAEYLEGPVTFAPLAEWRKEFFEPTLLERLCRQPDRPLAERVSPRPQLDKARLTFDAGSGARPARGRDGSEQVLVRAATGTLRVEVPTEAAPDSDPLTSVQLSVLRDEGGTRRRVGPAQELLTPEKRGSRDFSQPINLPQPGVYTLQVRLKTASTEATHSKAVRFQNPRPAIVIDRELAEELDRRAAAWPHAQLDFKASITAPAQRDKGPEVQLQADDKVFPWHGNGVVHPIPLEEGKQRHVKLSVRNRNALDGYEKGEEDSWERIVTYRPGADVIRVRRDRPDLGFDLLWEQPPRSVPDAHLTLKGKAVLNKPIPSRDEVQRRLSGDVHVFVNGIPQNTAHPKVNWREDDSSCEVEYELLLNQKQNEIVIDRHARGSPEAKVFQVACDNPQRPRLHLLIVTLQGEVTQQHLPQQVLDALQITQKPDKTLVSPVFEKVIMYPYNPDHPRHPVQAVWTAKPGQIRGCLPWDASYAGKERFEPGDVFLVYWHTNKDLRVLNGTAYLPTTDSKDVPNEEDDVTFDQLLLRGDSQPRLKILLLDVAGKKPPPEGTTAQLVGNNAIVLRHAWTRDPKAPPGLLAALREAAPRGGGEQPVRLSDVIQTARAQRDGELATIALEDQFEMLSRVMLRRKD
jgi:WD40 repeat protein